MSLENQEVEQLILDGRKRLAMTSVDSVDEFSDKTLKLTVKGEKVLIIGENIKVVSFVKSNGSLHCDGLFYEIKYNFKKQPIFKRLFK